MTAIICILLPLAVIIIVIVLWILSIVADILFSLFDSCFGFIVVAAIIILLLSCAVTWTIS